MPIGRRPRVNPSATAYLVTEKVRPVNVHVIPECIRRFKAIATRNCSVRLPIPEKSVGAGLFYWAASRNIESLERVTILEEGHINYRGVAE